MRRYKPHLERSEFHHHQRQAGEKQKAAAYVVPPVGCPVRFAGVVQNEFHGADEPQGREEDGDLRWRRPEIDQPHGPGKDEGHEGPSGQFGREDDGERLAANRRVAVAITEILCVPLQGRSARGDNSD